MSTSINNSGITFPDSTTQTSAAIQNSNIPVLSVYYSSSMSISKATYTVVKFDTIVLDTHSGWNSSGNYYTVPISGYYQINAATGITAYDLNVALTVISSSSGLNYQSGQMNGYYNYAYGYQIGIGANLLSNADTIYYLAAGTTVYVLTLGTTGASTLTNYGNRLQLYYIRS
jgi:hypothetical protein